MIASSISAIAFDLDGTLVDSVPDLAAATQATLADLGLRGCTQDQVRSWVGNGTEMLMRRALTSSLGDEPDASVMADAMPIFMRHYEACLERYSKLYPGVESVLGTLQRRGFKLAVVTNKPYRFTVPLLQAFGIESFFSEILGGDSLTKMKPDPLPLTHLLDKWQLQPQQMLMVGDSRNDVLAAKAAGIASIGLTYGYNYGEDIGLCGPDAVCDHFEQILAHLPPQQSE